MNKRLLFLCFYLLTNVFAQNNSENNPPNILIIFTDDLGYGDLSIQGATDMRTPNIDNIAKQGMIFKQFYANSPVCSPSRASLLTGKYPDMVGVPGVVRQVEEKSWGYFDENAVTLPQMLNEAGYHTGMIGKWHLGYEKPNIPNSKGFQHFKGFLGDMMDDYWTHLRHDVNWMRDNETEITPEGHATDIFTDWTIDYLKERQVKQQPFFLYLTYNAPHFPIQPPQKWLDKVQQREQNITEKRAKNVAFIEHLDFNIGRVMKALKETGLDDNTLVIFTSDNGGALRYAQSNSRLRGSKQQMYEGGIRVPGLMVWPDRIKKPVTIDTPCVTSDYFPTILSTLGIDLASDRIYDGLNLWPIIEGGKRDKPIGFLNKDAKESVWMEDRYKFTSTKKGEFLFDIIKDPAEKRNLFEKNAKIASKMSSELSAWKAGVLKELIEVQ